MTTQNQNKTMTIYYLISKRLSYAYQFFESPVPFTCVDGF